MRCECAENAGSLIAPHLLPADIAKLPKLPGAQTPVSSCSLPSIILQLTLSDLKQPRNKHWLLYGFKFLDLLCTEIQSCQCLVFLRARSSFMRSNGSIDYLAEGVPVLGHLLCEVKGDDLFRSALLLYEILSLDLEAWAWAQCHFQNKNRMEHECNLCLIGRIVSGASYLQGF